MALTEKEKRHNKLLRKLEKQALSMEKEMHTPQTIRVKGKSGGKTREQAENAVLSGFNHTLYLERRNNKKDPIPMELLPLSEQIRLQKQNAAKIKSANEAILKKQAESMAKRRSYVSDRF